MRTKNEVLTSEGRPKIAQKQPKSARLDVPRRAQNVAKSWDDVPRAHNSETKWSGVGAPEGVGST